MKESSQNNDFNETTSTGIPDDNYIQTYSESILSEPKFVLNSTNTEYLYSVSQMKAMFRLGYVLKGREKYMQKEEEKQDFSHSFLLRNMSAGDKLRFPFSDWGAVRTAASTIKKDFGATFRVRKLAPNGESGDIEVLRLT